MPMCGSFGAWGRDRKTSCSRCIPDGPFRTPEEVNAMTNWTDVTKDPVSVMLDGRSPRAERYRQAGLVPPQWSFGHGGHDCHR